MKQLLILLLLSSTTYGQMSIRKGHQSTGLSITIPVSTASNGSLIWTISKEHDRNLTYLNYTESIRIKKISLMGGAGIHLGSRQTINWKQDANSIFLAGFSAYGSITYQINSLIIGADIIPRVDLPIFGGCEMHKYCSESTLNSINFTIGLKL